MSLQSNFSWSTELESYSVDGQHEKYHCEDKWESHSIINHTLVPGTAIQVGNSSHCDSKFQTIQAIKRLTFRVATWAETFLKAPTIIKWFMSKSVDDMVKWASAGKQT